MVQHSFMAGRQRRMWSRHLQQGFNSRPLSCTREIRLTAAPQICFVPSPAPVPPSSPFPHPPCFYSTGIQGGPSICGALILSLSWRSREGALAMIKDSELVGKKVRNCEDLETLPHSSDTLPSLNMHRSYLLVSTALRFWQRRLWCSLNLRVRQ